MTSPALFWYIPAMALRGIIFDKDGTLFDYYSVWAPVFRSGTELILQRLGRPDDEQLRKHILLMLGIGETGVHSGGLVFDSSSKVMIARIWLFSRRWGISFRKLLGAFKEGYHGGRELLQESLSGARPAGDLPGLFNRLKDGGYTIGLATSDTAESTGMCLKILGIEHYFDFISTYDDHYRKKPHPQSLRAFCDTFSLHPRETAVVGDSVIDMIYGKRARAGYNIAVLTGCGDKRRLSRHADAVYENIFSLHEDSRLFR